MRIGEQWRTLEDDHNAGFAAFSKLFRPSIPSKSRQLAPKLRPAPASVPGSVSRNVGGIHKRQKGRITAAAERGAVIWPAPVIGRVMDRAARTAPHSGAPSGS